MSRRWTGLAGLGAAIALLASGCGGTSNASATSGGASPGASVAPASVPLYVSVDTDLSSDQWQAANTLLGKFPGRDKLVTQLRTSFEQSAKVSWENDVKPALGKELDLVVLDFKSSQVVGLTQPGDSAKWDALVKKLNADPTSKLVVADYKGWKIFSDKQATLDAYEQQVGAGALANEATYKDAIASLSANALVTAYANGPKVTAALQKSFPSAGASTGTQAKLVSGVAELVAQSDGLRLDGTFKAENVKTQLKPYKAALLDEVPAGALVYLSFNGEGLGQLNLRKQLEQGAGSTGAVIPGVNQLLPLLEQLGPLFAHENALYVRPGTLLPEVTLIMRPDSPQQGVATLDQLVAKLGGLAGAPKSITIGTTQAKVIDLGRFSIYYGAQGQDLIVTDQQQAFLDLKAGGAKLSGDATFKEAKAAAGLPDETNGFLYVNLKDAIPAIEGLAKLGGSSIPPDVSANLSPLRTFVAWGKGTGNEGSFTAFLGLR
jgi:hypothetical protein